MNRIVLAVCANNTVPFDFLDEYYRLRSKAVGHIESKGLFIDHNRNRAVNWALEYSGWDYLLFVDPDMTFPPDLMERIGQYTDPVVGGLYWRHTLPEPIAGMFVSADPLYDPLLPGQLLPMMENPGLYPVDCLGAGCLAIRRDVLENWSSECRPIFQTLSTPDGSTLVGEDVCFCWRLKQQNIPVLLDTSVCCGHLSSHVTDKNTYLAAHKRPS